VNDPHIEMAQADTKRALALFAHLRQIFQTARWDGKGGMRRPTHMDHADLLLSAASMRALFFDNRGQPIALTFLREHDIAVEMEVLETNVNLLLLSALVPDDWHVSDFLVDILLNPDMEDKFPVDQTRQTMYCFTDGKGFETVSQRPDLWVPTWVDDEQINSGVGISNLGAPAQLMNVTRRRVPLQQWGDIRIGYLKNISIRRRNLLTHVANQLGGVHYDSKRLPRDEKDRTEFQALSVSYDWDHQAIMHAGLVTVGLACIEIAAADKLFGLTQALGDFHVRRQQRLLKGEKLTR
jgi:hypothetical protein